jgi:hypothetical protein
MKLTSALFLFLLVGCGTSRPCNHPDLGFRLTARTEPQAPRSALLPDQLGSYQLVRVVIHNPGPARTVRLDCRGERLLVDVGAGSEEAVLFRVRTEPGARFSCEAS